MILYLSSATEDRYFAQMVKDGTICCGHQAQKFNSLVIRGLAEHTQVSAVSNPPYDLSKNSVNSRVDERDNLTYYTLSSNNSRFHKLFNFIHMNKTIRKIAKQNQIEAIVCDAVNVLASLNAIMYSKKYKVPTIAIVTDIPEYLAKGKHTIFTRMMDKLIKKYDGYVLLTSAMNPLVNLKNNPYIIMEGLCELGDEEADEFVSKKCDRPFTCVYTGSLALGTGIEALVQAVMLVEDRDVKLKIYGNGKLADEVKQAQEMDDRIEYCGIVTNEEAVKAQKEADLLVNPRPDNVVYGNVSFPSKVMEYMASGTPLLTTRLPGIPSEYFEHLYVIEDCSVEGIKRDIERILKLDKIEREKLAEDAKNFVLKGKNKNVQAKRILELISSL